MTCLSCARERKPTSPRPLTRIKNALHIYLFPVILGNKGIHSLALLIQKCLQCQPIQMSFKQLLFKSLFTGASLSDEEFFSTIFLCLSLMKNTEITEILACTQCLSLFDMLSRLASLLKSFGLKYILKEFNWLFKSYFMQTIERKFPSYEPLPTHKRIDLLDFHDFFCLLIVWLCFIYLFIYFLRRTLCEPFHLDEFRLLETCSQMASAQGQWIPQGLQEKRPFFWLSRWSHIWASLAYLHGLHVVHHGNLACL